MIGNERQSSAGDLPTGKTILVVKDDEAVGEVMVQALQKETFHQALRVSDGFQALKTVRGLKPNVFLLDYLIPGMNGITLYDHLHAIKELEDISAIMFSAYLPHVPANEVQKRPITFLSKPFKLAEHLQLIEKLIAYATMALRVLYRVVAEIVFL